MFVRRSGTERRHAVDRRDQNRADQHDSKQSIAVSSSSTLDMALTVLLTGGATITSSGSPTVLSVTGSGDTLD